MEPFIREVQELGNPVIGIVVVGTEPSASIDLAQVSSASVSRQTAGVLVVDDDDLHALDIMMEKSAMKTTKNHVIQASSNDHPGVPGYVEENKRPPRGPHWLKKQKRPFYAPFLKK